MTRLASVHHVWGPGDRPRVCRLCGEAQPRISSTRLMVSLSVHVSRFDLNIVYTNMSGVTAAANPIQLPAYLRGLLTPSMTFGNKPNMLSTLLKRLQKGKHAAGFYALLMQLSIPLPKPILLVQCCSDCGIRSKTFAPRRRTCGSSAEPSSTES